MCIVSLCADILFEAFTPECTKVSGIVPHDIAITRTVHVCKALAYPYHNALLSRLPTPVCFVLKAMPPPTTAVRFHVPDYTYNEPSLQLTLVCELELALADISNLRDTVVIRGTGLCVQYPIHPL